MPYDVQKHDSCPVDRPWTVVMAGTGMKAPHAGCHPDARSAGAQMKQMMDSESMDGPMMAPRALWSIDEIRAQMKAASINDLPDSAFAFIEPGGKKDESGKTVPRSLRHFPIHDAAHVRNALARAPQSPFGAKAMPKIRAAAKKFGIEVSGDGRSMEGSLMAEVERRYTPGLVEVRVDGDRRRIGGYALKFNVYSRNLGGFVERVNPSFPNKSRGDGWPDVMARYNHDNNMLLGTTGGGTLSMRVDDLGVEYEVEPPQARQDVVELVARGDVRRSSFAWDSSTTEDDWGLSEQNFPVRTLLSGRMVDVAPCNTAIAAYPDATAGLRSLADKMEASLEEVRTVLEQEGDLRKFFIRTDNAGKPAPVKLFGPAAAAQLLARRTDPWA